MLIYVGNGAFVPGVPARDLTDDEVLRNGGAEHLLRSGLYEQSEKIEMAGYENKIKRGNPREVKDD